MSDYNQAVQDALSDYATERSTARQTQKRLKSLGYKADLREGRSTGDIQVFKVGEDGPGLFYEFRNGGRVSLAKGGSLNEAIARVKKEQGFRNGGKVSLGNFKGNF